MIGKPTIAFLVGTGRFANGGRISAVMNAKLTPLRNVAHNSRPAGRIQSCQSGIKLGIALGCLPEPAAAGYAPAQTRSALRFLARYLSKRHIGQQGNHRSPVSRSDVTRATIAGGMARTGTDRWDVLIVGAGPSGAAAAYWLAEAGHRVLVVERKRFPRDKTCGDGLTPRAVRQLEDMGLAGQLAGSQRFEGLRSIGHGITLELAWPDHPLYPSYGYVVRRRELDEM